MIDIFVLTTKNDIIEELETRFPRIKQVVVKERKVTTALIEKITSFSMTGFFYLIVDPNIAIVDDWDFTYVPEAWDTDYIHIWNSSTNIRLISRKHAQKNPVNYNDDTLYAGNAKLKNHTKNIENPIGMSVIFLSYNEPFADSNYASLLRKVPTAKRVSGVKGLFNAHKKAAELATTTMFYVVDADAVLTDSFQFDYIPPESDRTFVHVWKSINPVNGLKYGYGGVKLFPTKVIRALEDWGTDFTTSSTDGFKVMPQVANISSFNCGNFNTWKSAFRECAKLASGIIKNADPKTLDRLDTWCNIGADKLYGFYAIEGAKAGRDFGMQYMGDPDMLSKVNDFEWLREEYEKTIDPEASRKQAIESYSKYFGLSWNER